MGKYAFMFACFGYEYGMGKILSRIKSMLDFTKDYLINNEIAKFLVAVFIIMLVVVILVGLR